MPSCVSRLSLSQRLAVDERHHVVEKTVVLARIEQGKNVRVLEVGGGLDLLEESLGAEDGSELRPQHFDGDRAVVLQIVSEVDVRHAAFAQVAFNLVAVSEGGREPGGDLGHGAKMGRLSEFSEVQCPGGPRTECGRTRFVDLADDYGVRGLTPRRID